MIAFSSGVLTQLLKHLDQQLVLWIWALVVYGASV